MDTPGIEYKRHFQLEYSKQTNIMMQSREGLHTKIGRVTDNLNLLGSLEVRKCVGGVTRKAEAVAIRVGARVPIVNC